jgi:hypothetical protein
MAEYSNTVQDDTEASTAPGASQAPANSNQQQLMGVPHDDQVSESEKALVKSIQKCIKVDKEFHAKAFKTMREDMFVARTGRVPSWPANAYVANLCGRHVKQKTAALYAKNPKAVAKRRETMDFVVWDENPQSLMMAMQTIQMAQQMLAQARPTPDPVTGEPVLAEPTPEMNQAFGQAQAIVADFQQGMQRRQQIDKIGKTLEILYAQAMREQKPVDFKTGMKMMVRRACTTGVGYVEIGFQREYGPRPGMTEKLADARARLDHLTALSNQVLDSENPVSPDDPEITELQLAVEALQNEPEIVLREGLIFDYPQATRVIPDKLCRELVGFIGSRHLTLEYMYTCDQVKEVFGVDLEKNYTSYSHTGISSDDKSDSPNYVKDEENEIAPTTDKGNGLVCVWKHYDKPSGLCYYVCDGYDKFLRKPASPDVFVEDFWPVYALTFNAVESENSLFPPSDVRLLWSQQQDYNGARQGQREHRQAARPRWVYPNGVFEEEDVTALKTQEPFDAIGINLPDQADIAKILQAVPVPGVDPNLYETGQIFTDIQLVVGSSESTFGGTSQATATESAIAANSTQSNDQASTDDLDAFLTVLARSSGQILLKEMSEEQVKTIVGPGALWPHLTLSDIASELYLEVEAGSSGKPNQAIEVQNFKELAPLIMQIPGISPSWMAKEAIKRLDDRIDLTDAIAEGMPAIVAQNRTGAMGGPQQALPPPGGQGTEAPADQGPQGAVNGPAAPATTQPGSEPAFGSNQV